MNGDRILEALDLPLRSRVDQRVPKKLLQENGAPTAADKRIINEGVEELIWLAALKPTTIGVQEYKDAVREYSEIAVLRISLRSAAKAGRLAELVHRAVPYPVLLLTERADGEAPIELSAAHKRWSQGEAGKTVLDNDIEAVGWDPKRDGDRWPAFYDALGVGKQPRSTLHELYQGWIDALLALQAARITGAFTMHADATEAVRRREALHEMLRLEAEISRLRSAAEKERQMARRVAINLELKRVEAARSAARSNL